MSHNHEIKCPATNEIAKPHVTSFDSGYEHSIEHLIQVRQMVEESDHEQITVTEEVRELVFSA
jgi:hypothetical protein